MVLKKKSNTSVQFWSQQVYSLTCVLFCDSSEIPNELRQLSRGGEVHVDMEDHRGEDYEPPKQPRVIAFAGEGHKLGR